jgi:hypothetical protein
MKCAKGDAGGLGAAEEGAEACAEQADASTSTQRRSFAIGPLDRTIYKKNTHYSNCNWIEDLLFFGEHKQTSGRGPTGRRQVAGTTPKEAARLETEPPDEPSSRL